MRLQLVNVNAKRRAASPPQALQSLQDEEDSKEIETKLANAESEDDSMGEQSNDGVESGTEGDTEESEDEFKAKREKKSKYSPNQQDQKPKVLKMIALTCKICKKSSKVIAA